MEKYPFLRRASSILRILAWVGLVLGIISSIFIGAMSAIGGIFTVMAAFWGIFCSVLGWVVLLAAAEVLLLLVDVEANSRKSAEGSK